jgi:transposase
MAAWYPQTKELISPYVFNGYTDAKRFNGWLKKHLLPCLKKGQVIIMDNAAFHKSQEIKNLIEEAGCKLLFQPPYSPDLNPIEQQWAVLKRKFKTFDEAVDYAFII